MGAARHIVCTPCMLASCSTAVISSLVAPALEQTPEEISKLITDRTNNKGELRAWDSGESILAKEINAMQANRLNKILEENPLGCLRIKSFYRRSPLNDPELTPLVGLINVASQPVGGPGRWCICGWSRAPWLR